MAVYNLGNGAQALGALLMGAVMQRLGAGWGFGTAAAALAMVAFFAWTSSRAIGEDSPAGSERPAQVSRPT